MNADIDNNNAQTGCCGQGGEEQGGQPLANRCQLCPNSPTYYRLSTGYQDRLARRSVSEYPTAGPAKGATAMDIVNIPVEAEPGAALLAGGTYIVVKGQRVRVPTRVVAGCGYTDRRELTRLNSALAKVGFRVADGYQGVESADGGHFTVPAVAVQ